MYASTCDSKAAAFNAVSSNSKIGLSVISLFNFSCKATSGQDDVKSFHD